ncbi:MAG: FecR domain-containing protein [Planctomycetota bacterium]
MTKDARRRTDDTKPSAALLAVFDRALLAEPDDKQAAADLEAQLTGNPRAAAWYLDYAALHADLYGAVRLARVRRSVEQQIPELVDATAGVDADMSAANPPLATLPLLERGARGRLSRFGFLAATLLLAAGLSAVVLPGSTPEADVAAVATYDPSDAGAQADAAEPLEESIATVVRLTEVEFADDSATVSEGETLLGDAAVRFESGLIEIEFRRGAVVVLEGPAEFVAVNDNAGLLHQGRLAAVVPPWADGFRVDTPKLQVIDRGTQFAVSVDENRNVDVAVTRGAVDVADAGDTNPQSLRRINAGGAVRSEDGNVDAIRQDATLVRLADELPPRPDASQAIVEGRYQHDFDYSGPDLPRQSGGWRYLTNDAGPIGDPRNYRNLLWDPEGEGCYDSNGSDPRRPGPPGTIVKLRQSSGHTGWGSLQAPDGIDHYAIAAFAVPVDGVYYVRSGWIHRPESRRPDGKDSSYNRQTVDVVVHVDDQPLALQGICRGPRVLKFESPLGRLKAGSTVYVGVGPDGDNFNDRFEWGFFVVRDLTPDDDPNESLPLNTPH